MKKRLFTILAVAAMAFVGCSKDDDKTIDNLEEKIIGKWIMADEDGQPMSTNMKAVYTFISTSKAYVSVSLNNNQDMSELWDIQTEKSVVIDGNKVILASHSDEHTTMVEEFTLTAINSSEFTANRKGTVTVDGNEIASIEDVVRFVKVTDDYSQAVLGKWECTGLTGIETYNDANAQLEFYQDGTYNYWRKNGDQWEAVTNREFQNYFVDGTLLATRWKNQGEEELREWWEIASIAGNQMEWTALRKKEDGTTVTQTMTWVKVN